MSNNSIINNHFPSNIFDKKCSGPCIVVGSGPSQRLLTHNKEWKNYYTISSNWSQIAIPSQIYGWQDKVFISRAKSKLVTHRSISASVLPTSKNPLENTKLMKGLGGIYINRVRTKARPGWIESYDSTNMQSPCPISGVLSICLAYTMGFNPIVLVGYDCNPGNYKYNTKHPILQSHENTRAARIFAKSQSKFISDYSKELNLINCSRTDAMPQSNYLKTMGQLGSSNRAKEIKNVENVLLDNADKNDISFFKKWQKRLPIV